jgi:hypothetical protein
VIRLSKQSKLSNEQFSEGNLNTGTTDMSTTLHGKAAPVKTGPAPFVIISILKSVNLSIKITDVASLTGTLR